MSELESLENLRKYGMSYNGVSQDAIMRHADAIQAEVDKAYMRLPVDADGVPIHVGDEMMLANGSRVIVLAVNCGRSQSDAMFHTAGGKRFTAYMYKHAKPRTLEDVLNDFVNEVAHQGHQIGLTAPEIIKRYETEISELMEFVPKLGSGTCEWVLEHSGTLYDKWRCSECGYLYVESRTDQHKHPADFEPNFCPSCGAKVVC